MQETMRKLGQLAPVIELLKADFAPSNLEAYNKARLQRDKAMSELNGRTGITITSLYVIDGAATLASLAIPGYGAVKTAAVEAGKKGGRSAAWKAGIAVAGKQVVVTGAAVGATVIVLPPAMRASGLQEHQIVAGMAVLQVFGITRSLKYVKVVPNSVEVLDEVISSGRYTRDVFEGRNIYRAADDIDLGVPTNIDPKYVHRSIRQKIDNGWTNADLMRNGNAPIGTDGRPVNLHHVLGDEPGPMVEILGSTHKRHHGPLHGLIEDGNSFRNTPGLENKYISFRKRYWKWRDGQLTGN